MPEVYNSIFEEMLGAGKNFLYLVARHKDTRDFIDLVSLDPHHDGVYKELSIKKIVSETQVANKASCSFLNKLGMKVIDKVTRFNPEQYIFLLEL